MKYPTATARGAVLIALVLSRGGMAAVSPASIYASASRSMVVVQYQWDSELGRRQVNTPGVVVGADGLVMCGGGIFDERVAEKQIKDVKILVPRAGREPLELDAEYQGRDDRVHLAFVRAKTKQAFEPIVLGNAPGDVGESFWAIGMMGESSGYKTFLTHGTIAAVVPGERTQMLVDGSLPGVGSPVMNSDGRMIGFVESQPAGRPGQPPPVPNMFTPIDDLIGSIGHPPTPSRPTILPWFGVFEMNALKQEELAYYALSDPAVQVSALADQGPAARAGLKQGDLIIGLDGKPLDAGDTPEQVPALLRRRLLTHQPGDTVVVKVITAKAAPPQELSVKLEANPARPSQMDRYWAEDLGFGVRELAYVDRYVQHLAPGAGGVIVSVTKPDGPAASARVLPNVLILKLNGQAITGLADFVKQYAALRAARPQDAVVLLTRRDGRDETVRIEPNKQ